MSGLTLAIGLAVLEATLFVAGATWLLLRIERRSEDAAQQAQSAFTEMRTLVREMRGAEELLRSQAERVLAASSGVPPGAARQAARVATGNDVDAGGEHALDTDHERLAAQKGRLEGELEALRPRLREMESQLGDMLRERRAAATAATVTEALRTTNGQLMNELREARQANREFRAHLEPLTAGVNAMQAQISAIAEGQADGPVDARAVPADGDHLAERHHIQATELKRELERHKHHLEQLQDELSRTLREKSFIEDRFLDIVPG